ncbi:hypothetical protein D043_4847B, partial [Vibrio parahaemolyticus EKP-021]
VHFDRNALNVRRVKNVSD